jgi:outer membrane protein TolC
VIETETTLRQQEVRLKNLLSREGPDAATLRGVRIVPVDSLAVPAKDDNPAMDEMVGGALKARSDLAIQLANQMNSEINALGTRNGLLPTLVAFASTRNSGLAGTPGSQRGPDPYFVGGTGDVLGQVFRRNFPTNQAGAFFSMTLNNRQGQADQAIDQLQLRQSELNLAKARSQVQVEVLDNAIAMQQARARHESARENVKLQEQLYEAEDKKMRLGASTPYNVIQAQRDVSNARFQLLQAVVAYTNARLGLDQMLGRTLEANNVQLSEATGGAVERQSVPVEPR